MTLSSDFSTQFYSPTRNVLGGTCHENKICNPHLHCKAAETLLSENMNALRTKSIKKCQHDFPKTWVSHGIPWHPKSHGSPPVARLWTAPWISSVPRLCQKKGEPCTQSISGDSRGDMEKAWKIQSQFFPPFFLDLYSLLADFPWFSSNLRCLARSSPSLFGLISLGVAHFGPQLLHPLPGQRPNSAQCRWSNSHVSGGSKGLNPSGRWW